MAEFVIYREKEDGSRLYLKLIPAVPFGLGLQIGSFLEYRKRQKSATRFSHDEAMTEIATLKRCYLPTGGYEFHIEEA